MEEVSEASNEEESELGVITEDRDWAEQRKQMNLPQYYVSEQNEERRKRNIDLALEGDNGFFTVLEIKRDTINVVQVSEKAV